MRRGGPTPVWRNRRDFDSRSVRLPGVVPVRWRPVEDERGVGEDFHSTFEDFHSDVTEDFGLGLPEGEGLDFHSGDSGLDEGSE
jgi:hypothetical protein